MLYIIWYSGKKAGERTVSSPFDPEPVPTPSGEYDASILSNKLKNVIKGIQPATSTITPVLQEFAQIPFDEMFIAVNNHYNKHHHEVGTIFKSSETLRKQLEGEFYLVWSDPYKWRSQIISKMDRLKID